MRHAIIMIISWFVARVSLHDLELDKTRDRLNAAFQKHTEATKILRASASSQKLVAIKEQDNAKTHDNAKVDVNCKRVEQMAKVSGSVHVGMPQVPSSVA